MSSTSSAVAEQSKTKAVDLKASFLNWKFLVILAMVGLAYQDVIRRLVHQWSTDANFSHGFIVPLFSLFVVWSKRSALAELTPKPNWFGLVVILGSLGLLVVGSLGAELFLARVSLIFLVAGLVLYFFGWKHFKVVLFPWLCLFLMVPLPAIIFSQITLPLQMMAAKLAAAALQMIGIPVLREGNVINLPAMPLEVAEACSGIRSLLSLGTLAIIYGYFLETKMAGRVLLALASIPIAVFANAFRIFGTGITVEYWDADKALGFFHEFSGWLVFLVSMLLLFAVHKTVAGLYHLAEKRRGQ